MSAIAQINQVTAESNKFRLKYWIYLFLVDELVAELDAIIKAPRAYNTQPWKVSESDWNLFLSVIENPPEPNKALIAAFKQYGRSR